MADSLEDVIEEAAQKPQAASNDAGSVTMPSIPDLIQADQYLAAKRAAQNPRRGLRITKLIPPGAV